MKEVIEYEDIIRAALANVPAGMLDSIVVRDARSIMKNGPTHIVGSRKDRLRFLAEKLKVYVPEVQS